MSAHAYFIISIAGYGMAALLFLVAVFLFFHKNVIGIINDLSGKTAARQIIEIRKRNCSTQSTHKVSSMYEQLENKGKVDDRYLHASRTSQMAHVSKRLDLNTGEIKNDQPIDASLQQEEQPTDVLRQQNAMPADAWTQQEEQPTDVLRQQNAMPAGAWTQQNEQPTDVLRQQDTMQQKEPAFQMEQYEQSESPTNVLSQDESDFIESDSSESETTVLENQNTPEFRIICDVESVFTDEVIR